MNSDGLPVKLNRSRIGLHGTVNNFHQGGFASAVFAEHREHLARIYFKADPVVGSDAGVSFSDVLKPQSRRHNRTLLKLSGGEKRPEVRSLFRHEFSRPSSYAHAHRFRTKRRNSNGFNLPAAFEKLLRLRIFAPQAPRLPHELPTPAPSFQTSKIYFSLFYKALPPKTAIPLKNLRQKTCILSEPS